MRFWTSLGQFLRVFLPSLSDMPSFPPLYEKNFRQNFDCNRGVYMYFVCFDTRKQRYTDYCNNGKKN